jgi:hypothetical protein
MIRANAQYSGIRIVNPARRKAMFSRSPPAIATTDEELRSRRVGVVANLVTPEIIRGGQLLQSLEIF